ncbi:hypothetical protein CURTO8I2_60145 [Curtobacterium sp. 8I-2]|nr:hypothetical protein CURTO8I2_60145 [Curtobacterium sp. 8I-2]
MPVRACPSCPTSAARVACLGVCSGSLDADRTGCGVRWLPVQHATQQPIQVPARRDRARRRRDTGGVCLGRAARRHRDGHRARAVAVRVRAGVRTAVVGRVRLDGTVHRFRVVRRFRFCFR